MWLANHMKYPTTILWEVFTELNYLRDLALGHETTPTNQQGHAENTYASLEPA